MNATCHRPERSEMVRIVGIHHLGGHSMRLLFSDGWFRDLDLGPMLRGPAFDRHRSDPAFFARARVMHGTIAWPDDSDLDALVLRGHELPATGEPPRVLHEAPTPPAEPPAER